MFLKDLPTYHSLKFCKVCGLLLHRKPDRDGRMRTICAKGHIEQEVYNGISQKEKLYTQVPKGV